MITNHPVDNDYAKACQEILNNAAHLSAVEINKKFVEIGQLYFPNYDTEPKNLMLNEVYGSVLFDELDPNYPGADHSETSERIRTVISDYLAGNFYPTYFSLSGSYGDDSHGLTFVATVSKGHFIVVSGHELIRNTLRAVSSSVRLTGNDEADLYIFQSKLPTYIERYVLSSSEVEEYVA